ncbi:MAG: hypothetical protein RL497_2812 [Pseudomonadota bacterium]|jgi:hypothetical protein
MLRLLLITAAILIFPACQTTNTKNPPQKSLVLGDQKKLTQHFATLGYTTPDRNLVALIHVCTLEIAQHAYPVIDLRELAKSPNSPRGINRIMVLNEKLEKLNAIDYTKGRPLHCKNNKLYLGAEVQLSEFPEPGNVLTFDRNGSAVQLEMIDTSHWF